MRRGRWKARTSNSATISECRAYLYNIDPTNNLCSNLQVHRAEKLLDLKRKAASTIADLAFLPQNMDLVRILLDGPPPPLGMGSVLIADIIGIVEAGFFLEHLDRKFGKTMSPMCCSHNGHGDGEKVNLLLAICDNNAGLCWHEQVMEGGSTIERFYGFTDHIVDDLDQNHPVRSFFSQWTISAHTKIPCDE